MYHLDATTKSTFIKYGILNKNQLENLILLSTNELLKRIDRNRILTEWMNNFAPSLTPRQSASISIKNGSVLVENLPASNVKSTPSS